MVITYLQIISRNKISLILCLLYVQKLYRSETSLMTLVLIYYYQLSCTLLVLINLIDKIYFFNKIKLFYTLIILTSYYKELSIMSENQAHRRRLNPRSLIQLSKTLLIELTRTHTT